MSNNGKTIPVGSRFYDCPAGSDQGHLRIFEWSGSAWVQKGSNSFDHGVSLSGGGLIVATSGDANDCNGITHGYSSRAALINCEAAGNQKVWDGVLFCDGNGFDKFEYWMD
mmetsp:Transcript_27581/g.46296  ORF Transcript_27581/g.46296 Transcript_27581/m.46296 type:complete len:111 (-) Transcript_27581:107-439(-)